MTARILPPAIVRDMVGQLERLGGVVDWSDTGVVVKAPKSGKEAFRAMHGTGGDMLARCLFNDPWMVTFTNNGAPVWHDGDARRAIADAPFPCIGIGHRRRRSPAAPNAATLPRLSPRHHGGAFLCPPPCPVKPARHGPPPVALNLPPAHRARWPLPRPTRPVGRGPRCVPRGPVPRAPCRHPGRIRPACRGPPCVGRVPWAVGRARLSDPGACHPQFANLQSRPAIRAGRCAIRARRIRAAMRHPRRAGRAYRAACRALRGPIGNRG
jgi:hypothetical protein